MQSAATWEALGPVEDMPTPRSSPKSEYRSTDRGSEANCEEEAKENRCPLSMEGVTDQLVNTAGASEQYPESALGSSWTQTAREPSKRSSRFRQPRKLHSVPNSSKSDESSFWKRAGDRARRGQHTERPGSSITSGTRQSVPAGHPRPIWSRFLPRLSAVADQKKVTNALLQLFQAFQTQLAHHTSSALGRRGLGSARETTSSQGPKRTVTLCPNQDWSWLESRPLRTSSPLTERQRLQKSSLEFEKPRRYPENVCQWVRDALCGKRPGPRQQESTSQNWRQRAQNCCLQLETTGARSPGSRRMGGPSS